MKTKNINNQNEAPESEENIAALQANETPLFQAEQIKQILCYFYSRLILTEADRRILFEKRGLMDATIDALGFRSNLKSNLQILLEMAKLFSMTALVESGLWIINPFNPDEPAKPNPQFYGMGIVEKRDAKGKKVRDENGEVEVEEWLEKVGATQVVVGYDNENKADEKLPGYQREKHKRFDTHIWARYLARQLSKQGYDGRVCVLPDAWRDENGKADWDGRLSVLVRQAGLSDGSMDSWEKIRERVRAEFLAVIQSGRTIGEFKHPSHFESETERIIRGALAKISYEPCLPVGRAEEQLLAQRFFGFASRLKHRDWIPFRACAFLKMLACSYQATLGRYYRMKPLAEKQAEMWEKIQEDARRREDHEVLRACNIVLRGRKTLKATKRGHIPETISDFYFQPIYVLRRTNGTRTRVVIVHTIHGAASQPVEIPWNELGSPATIRDFLCRSVTSGSWDGGQSEASALHEDLGHELSFREVIEVPLRGYHARSKIWCFEDVAFTDTSEIIPDSKTNILWNKHEGSTQGYSYARNEDGQPRDREDDAFRQGVPKMHPEIKDAKDSVACLFKEILSKLPDAVGKMEAYLALGMIFLSAAGPEIFEQWSCYPGLWIHGAQGEGKSALARWLIRIWGFAKDKGLPLPADEQRTTLTQAALSGALGQYGFLPLWLDEYQPSAPAWVRSILKNSYDRAEGAKKDFGASPREFLASVIVSGVATSSEPQTKSRFAHIHVSSKNRTADHYQWFQANSREFYRLGRHVLRHRQQFVSSVTAAMQSWEKSSSLKGVNDRARMVHGLAYAGLHAVCELFDVPVEWNAYRTWLVEHCKKSALDIKEQGILELFWRELMSAIDAGVFGKSHSDLQRYFQAIEEKVLRAAISPHQLKEGADESYKAWKSYLFYFKPAAVLDLIRAHKRRCGGDLPFTQSDLLSQMKLCDYWHPPKHSSGHRQKFGTKSSAACWGIRVDLHELGYLQVSDEEFDGSFAIDAGQGTFPTAETWSDPRKGDLFGLINMLIAKKEED